MAVEESTQPVNVTNIQFELDSICRLFDLASGQHFDGGTDLLVVASKYGTRIVGHPSSCELQILYFKNKTNLIRNKYKLRGTPKILSLNCDENFLTVNYKENDGSYIDIFSVHLPVSSSTETLRLLNSFRFDCMAKQILWNPIVSQLFAICLDDGLSVCFFEAKDELKTIERENARCVCWSSQGDEIVVALLNGILRQYDLERSSIKTINSPKYLFDGPYEPIALKWLSTYQFAIIFLENSCDAQPKLFIINTINEHPIYMGFDDTIYSPRVSDVYLIYMPKWNLILTGSKNDNKVNILTTNETTEMPSWKQMNFMDETQARLPLAVEDHRPYSMLGIALENQAQQFANEIPLISTISTCGRLMSVKLVLTKTIPSDADENALNADCTVDFPHIEIKNEIMDTDAEEQRLAKSNTPTVGGLSTNQALPAQDPLDAILKFHTVREKMSEAVEKLNSVVRNSLKTTDNDNDNGNGNGNGNGNNSMEYLHSLATAAATTIDEIERLKNNLHSLSTTLAETTANAQRKIALPANRMQVDESTFNNSAKNLSIETDTSSSLTVEDNRCLIKVENSIPSTKEKCRMTTEMKELHQKSVESHPFTCDICNRQYVRKEAVKKHIYIKHARKYVTTSKTKQSQKQKDANSHPLHCNICGERYAKKYAFEMHIRIKHGKNHLESTTMDKGIQSFVEKPNQKTAKSHPFRCNVCGERYKHQGRLSFHQKNDHTGKVSIGKNIIHVVHVQGGQMRYKCKECTYMTNHSGNFGRHRKLCKGKGNLSSVEATR